MAPSLIAFAGSRLLAHGPAPTVALAAKRADRARRGPLLVFDAVTSLPVELDLRGSDADVLARLEPAPPKRLPGRPRLGVVAREVTLLPRHWDWLGDQPGGASVTLRKLVEQARAQSMESDRVRLAREAAHRFMMAMAGDRPGLEEALRALYAGDVDRVKALSARWPVGIHRHLLTLLGRMG
ncbi:MAG: DUF2239 family protein [Gemmatimonadetes bacterium]|nr:DUF2239 family protein [Gemmatimonadota bacterium]